MDKLNNSHDSERTTLACPHCGAPRITTVLQSQQFPYGAGPHSVTLEATVPVRTCSACGFTFTDREGEEVRHEAVCRHLKVMAPRRIRQLRELHRYSQAAFAEVTRLGEATLSRWERGIIIQNAAYDSYLYLLGFPENLQRLIVRARTLERRSDAEPTARFRSLQVNDELLRRSTAFTLVLS